MNAKPFATSLLTLAIAGCAMPAGDASRKGLTNNPESIRKQVLPPRKPMVPPVKDVQLQAAWLASARKEIEGAFTAEDPILRGQAIEAAGELGREDLAPQIIARLEDQTPSVRFAAAMTIGKMRLRQAYRPLQQAINDDNASVKASVIYALHRLGDTRYSEQLTTLAENPNAGVRGNVAIILGLLDEPSASKLLEPMRRDPSASVRLQADEALWRLNGDMKALSHLVEASLSIHPDDQIIAVQAMATRPDPRLRPDLEGKLTTDYAEVNLAAARALGKLGSDDGFGIALNGASASEPRLRFMSAFALGAIGRSDGAPTLVTLMDDKDPHVRLAAATAITQLADGGRVAVR